MLESIITSGLTSVGLDVFYGPMPTPAVSMLIKSTRADLGIMISASHNTYEYNGIKIFGPDGYKLDDIDELEIEGILEISIAMTSAREWLGRQKDRRRTSSLY